MVLDLGFRGFGFRIQGLGVWDLGFKGLGILDLGFGAEGFWI